MLGTELQSFGRARSSFNHRAKSPTLIIIWLWIYNDDEVKVQRKAECCPSKICALKLDALICVELWLSKVIEVKWDYNSDTLILCDQHPYEKRKSQLYTEGRPWRNHACPYLDPGLQTFRAVIKSILLLRHLFCVETSVWGYRDYTNSTQDIILASPLLILGF